MNAYEQNRTPDWVEQAMESIEFERYTTGTQIMDQICNEYIKVCDSNLHSKIHAYKKRYDENPLSVWRWLVVRYPHLRSLPLGISPLSVSQTIKSQYSTTVRTTHGMVSIHGCKGCKIRLLDDSNSMKCDSCGRLRCNNCGTCLCG